jgi:lipopolysaccharide transport protein LptA
MRTYMPQRLAKAPLATAFLIAAAATLPSHGATPASGSPSSGATAEKCADICLDSADLEGDPTDTIMHDFHIVYAALGITAKSDLAEIKSPTGDIKNANLVLTVHVQIVTPQGQLNADRATLQVVNGHIVIMTAQGSPAEFAGSGNPLLPVAVQHAHGHAGEIVYDLEHNELQLNGDAHLTNGCWELDNENISYDLVNQRVRADSNNASRVSGVACSHPQSGRPGTDKP